MTNKVKLRIWEREFELEAKYDCYAGEEVLDFQKEALEAFIKSESNIAASLEAVKNYCCEQNGDDIGDSVITNIFKFVAPKYLYITRNTEKHVVAIMCNYKFDQENGIAVVFESENFCRIGKQDIIL